MHLVRTKFEFLACYLDELRPKNNEFVESGLENWALVNQMNTGRDSNDKRMKRKRVVLKKNRPQPSLRRSVLIYYSQVRLQVWFWNAILFFLHFFHPLISLPPSSFILSSLFISIFHLYARWLVLILIPSAPPISPHVVAIRLKYTVQVSLLHLCGQGVSCSAFNAEVATFSPDILGLLLI